MAKIWTNASDTTWQDLWNIEMKYNSDLKKIEETLPEAQRTQGIGIKLKWEEAVEIYPDTESILWGFL